MNAEDARSPCPSFPLGGKFSSERGDQHGETHTSSARAGVYPDAGELRLGIFI